MDINVSCDACGDSLEVVRQWAKFGDIEVTVKPCFCVRGTSATGIP